MVLIEISNTKEACSKSLFTNETILRALPKICQNVDFTWSMYGNRYTGIPVHSVLIRETTSQIKFIFWHILRKRKLKVIFHSNKTNFYAKRLNESLHFFLITLFVSEEIIEKNKDIYTSWFLTMHYVLVFFRELSKITSIVLKLISYAKS